MIRSLRLRFLDCILGIYPILFWVVCSLPVSVCLFVLIGLLVARRVTI